MKKIVVVCPSNVVTGGPLLLHQMCYELRRIGYDSYMYYYKSDAGRTSDTVPDEYKIFNNPCVNFLDDNEENIFVLPEVYVFLLKQFKRAQCIFWWLSVDGYYNSMGDYINQNSKIDLRTDLKTLLKESLIVSKVLYNKNLYHFVQSQYALEHCRQIGIEEANIRSLSDYLDPVFIKNAIIKENHIKEDIILFNPKKGYEFTKLLMNAAPQFIWVPLVNLSAGQMANLLKKAKLYIDFGEHPGKDRIPREAVISGCCLITGKKGSAQNKIDIPIPDIYKFDDEKNNLNLIVDKIQDIFSSYQTRYKDFFYYKKIILKEEALFKIQLRTIFENIAGNCFAEKNVKSSTFLLKNAYEKLQDKAKS